MFSINYKFLRWRFPAKFADLGKGWKTTMQAKSSGVIYGTLSIDQRTPRCLRRRPQKQALAASCRPSSRLMEWFCVTVYPNLKVIYVIYLVMLQSHWILNFQLCEDDTWRGSASALHSNIMTFLANGLLGHNVYNLDFFKCYFSNNSNAYPFSSQVTFVWNILGNN